MTVALLLLGTALAARNAAPAPVAISTNPPRVCADDSSSRSPNFDFVIRNGTERPLTITEIKAQVFNPAGNLLEQKILWQDALTLLGAQKIVAAGKEGLVYNPFRFVAARAGTKIDYSFSFAERPSPLTISVQPRSCVTKARLRLPLRGRILVYDGYDFLSHHRRQSYQMQDELRAFGFVDNTYRFGIDFIPVDASGRLFRGDGAKMEEWFGWGMPVRAAGDGIVAAVRDDMPDNPLGSEDYPKKRLSEDEMNSDGNYVLIDHGTGEFSSTTHLKQGSAKVGKGDRVKAGQIIAAIGNSGATPVPHLHYELRTGWGVKGIRNLPPYFHDVQLVGQATAAKQVAPNTGDVLIAR